MDNQSNNTLVKSVKYWWSSLLIGAMAIILGVWCFLTPIVTMTELTYLFVTVFLVTGILEILYAIYNRHNMSGWGWSLAGGILEVLLAVLIVSMPMALIAGFLILFIGFWILFRSIWMIGESIEVKRSGIGGWKLLLYLAILGVLSSLIFFFSPIRGGEFSILFLSIALVIYGIFRINLALRLRTVGQQNK